MQSAKSLFEEFVQAGLIVDNNWKVRQSDLMDHRTKFIYKCDSIAEIKLQCNSHNLTSNEKSYAVHRWRNFKRHEAWMSLLFEMIPDITGSSNAYDKTKDFSLEINSQRLWFDLKVTRFPSSLQRDLPDNDLAVWFYNNQSIEGRFHLSNRFFIVGSPESSLYDFGMAKSLVSKFLSDRKNFCHFLTHRSGNHSSAIVLKHISH